MAETISQHQTTTFTTPVNNTLADASIVLGNDNTLVSNNNAHDADPGIHVQSSTLANRPAAGSLGRKWLTTDESQLYYDTGAAWVRISQTHLVGTSTTFARPTLILYENVALFSNANVDTSVATFSLPANALAVNGQAIRITATGSLFSGVCGYNIKFGATSVATRSSLGGIFYTQITLSRAGATDQRAVALHTVGDPLLSGAGQSGVVLTSPTETLTGAITIDFRVTSNGTNGSGYESILVEYLST